MVGKNNYKIYNLDLYEFLEYKILDELKFKASIAGSINLQKYQSFRPAILDVNGRRKSTNQDDTKTSWTHEDVLTYNKTFNKDHALTVLGGFSLQEFKTEMTKLAVVDNISDAIEISNAYGGVDGLPEAGYNCRRVLSHYSWQDAEGDATGIHWSTCAGWK